MSFDDLDDIEGQADEFVASRPDQGLSSEELRVGFQAEIGQLLQPDETLACAVRLSPSPGWRRMWIQERPEASTTSASSASSRLFDRMAAVTDRNVYVFKGTPPSFGRGAEVLFKAPLGSVDASVRRSVSGRSVQIRQYKKRWRPTRLWLAWGFVKDKGIHRGALDRARQIADSASGRPRTLGS
jgi:hypothetical protein